MMITIINVNKFKKHSFLLAENCVFSLKISRIFKIKNIIAEICFGFCQKVFQNYVFSKLRINLKKHCIIQSFFQNEFDKKIQIDKSLTCGFTGFFCPGNCPSKLLAWYHINKLTI